MKPLLPTLTLLLAITGIDTGRAADDPVWHSDVDKAKSLARTSKRPLMVVFR